METFFSRREAVLERMAAAAVRAGRAPQDIELVAVSKTQPPEIIREAHESGQSVFGENRVQELLSKVPALPSVLTWHLIGHLQSNKIRKVLPVCALIHGVDSMPLARDMDRIAGELGLFPKILLEVNVSGEASKFGFPPETLLRDLPNLLGLQRVSIEGFMTMAPLTDDPQKIRPVFRALRTFRDRCANEAGIPLTILSMGMTNDFEIAIEEGATHVRIGSALFGSR